MGPALVEKLATNMKKYYHSVMNGNSHSSVIELDEPTTQAVEQLARNWGVSKQEAVRRAIIQVSASATSTSNEEKLAAFKALQRSLHLTPVTAGEAIDGPKFPPLKDADSFGCQRCCSTFFEDGAKWAGLERQACPLLECTVSFSNELSSRNRSSHSFAFAP